MPRWLNPKLGQRDNGTTLRHVYKRGEYEGDVVTAHVQGERINISGDTGPDNSDYTTRTPSGCRKRTGDTEVWTLVMTRYGYSGWDWWEYQTEDREWIPISELPEWTRP